jgi:3-oxoacyl-[acyl-carrier protein] reductase
VQRTAVVTGGAGGIGQAIVRALSASGHDVAILDREGEFAVDLADEQDVRGIAERLGPRDVLVHAAAAFDRASLGDLDLATWRHVQAVNVESALWLCQALTPAMSARGFGRIIFIASNTVWRPPAADFLPYVASKATLIGIARALAKPLGEHAITVNCVAPGLTCPHRRSRTFAFGRRSRGRSSPRTPPHWSRFSPPMPRARLRGSHSSLTAAPRCTRTIRRPGWRNGRRAPRSSGSCCS